MLIQLTAAELAQSNNPPAGYRLFGPINLLYD